MAKKKVIAETPATPTVDATEQVGVMEGEQTSQEATQEATQEQPTETVEEPTNEEEAPAAAKEKKQTAKKDKKVEAVQVPESDIPEHVKSVLKAFHNYRELYIGKAGEVFTKGTKPSDRGTAILYRNPYFKQ